MKRILIVEDDIELCLMLSYMLGEFGFDTAVAGDGLKALSILAEADPLPDVILLDLLMPNMDGWELKSKLSEDLKYRNIPIIVMSADSNADKVEAEAHLNKPFASETMIDILKKLLN